MKFLIVGRGSIALKHKSILESSNHEVKLLHDFLEDSCSDDDIHQIFKDKVSEFDGAIIANASNKHFEFTKMALEKNKYIYLEKPPCLDLNELNELINIESYVGKHIAVGFQLRFSNGINKLKDHMNENIKNKILAFNIKVGQKLEDWRSGGINKNSYYANYDTGGGVIYELCHEIDLALWLFGNPEDVISKSANLSHPDMNIHDYCVSIWNYKDKIGTVSMDMIDPTYTRYIELIYRDHKILWNMDNDKLLKITKSEIKTLYEDNNFTRKSLIESSLKNFTDYIANSVSWGGAKLIESINLLKIIDNMHHE